MPHHVRLICVAVASLLPFTACSSDPEAPEPDKESTSEVGATTISLAHPFPAESLPGQAAEAFADLVAEESGGELAVEVTAEAEIGVGEQLASELEDGMRAVLVTTTGTGLDPRLQLQSLPFLATSQEEADELFYGDGLVADYEAGVFEEHGVHAIYQFATGFRGLSTSGKAVREPKDLDGLRVRVFPAPWMIEAFESWGATPEDVPADKLKESLETGDLDGQESGIRSFIGNGLTEVQGTFTDLRHSYATYTLVMDDAAWDELSDEERRVLEQAAREASQSSGEAVEAADEHAYESLGDEVKLVEPTEEEYAAWQASVSDVHAKYRRVFGKKIIKSLSKRAGS